MTNCLTFSELVKTASDVIIVAFCIGGIVGTAFAAWFLQRKGK